MDPRDRAPGFAALIPATCVPHAASLPLPQDVLSSRLSTDSLLRGSRSRGLRRSSGGGNGSGGGGSSSGGGGLSRRGSGGLGGCGRWQPSMSRIASGQHLADMDMDVRGGGGGDGSESSCSSASGCWGGGVGWGLVAKGCWQAGMGVSHGPAGGKMVRGGEGGKESRGSGLPLLYTVENHHHRQ